jgi:hypothetical protein
MNEAPRPGTEVQALNFVYSAMIGHQGEDGSDPLRAVNIETLVSAVRLLQARESHEVAPFVAAWKAGALGFGRSTSRVSGREVQTAINSAVEGRFPNGDGLVRLIERVARDVTRSSGDSSFRTLELALLKGIRAELTDLSSVDYLRPLADLARAQHLGLDVITLNYDRTVEIMAADAGVELDTGIERWTPGVPLAFQSKDGQINLYKLHGSVDWELIDERPSLRVVRPPRIEVIREISDNKAPDPDEPPRRTSGLPWIVVGDREKLATDGPTLDLLHAASEAFARATNLVVVGYSFADAHINAMIRNWMAADRNRTMTVVDPGWPELGGDDPRALFANEYGGSDDRNADGAVPRIAAIVETAANGLATSLSTVPSRPEIWATAEWAPRKSAFEVIVKMVGPTLQGVHVESIVGGQFSSVLATAEERKQRIEAPRPGASWAQVGTLTHGGRVSVFPIVPAGHDSLELVLDGFDLVGHRRIRLPPLAVPLVARR